MSDTYDMFENARTTDPQTSHDAAESMQDAAVAQRLQVYRTLSACGELTSEEISARCDLTHAQAWRRVSDLRRMGWVEWTGKKRVQTSGRKGNVWRTRW